MLQYDTGLILEPGRKLFTPSLLLNFFLFLFLPEWFIIAVSSLSILGVLALVVIMATILLCYLRRPEKTPAALASTFNYRISGRVTVMQSCTVNCVGNRTKSCHEDKNKEQKEIIKLVVNMHASHS